MLKFTKKMTRAEREGAVFSLTLHGALILLAFFIIVGNEPQRYAYLEVAIGDFKQGTQSAFSLDKPEKVATDPTPSVTEPIDPKPVEEAKPAPESRAREEAKPVEAPKQTQQVESEIIRTPETTRVRPERTADRQRQEVTVPPKVQEAERREEGAERTGDIRGTTGRPNTDQGTAEDDSKSAPYSLEWEGDIVRAPVSQPLPNYVEEIEAVITVRFEVGADGRVRTIIPLRKMSPALEREIKRTLQGWQFERLPSGVPQESQWGRITFRFVLD